MRRALSFLALVAVVAAADDISCLSAVKEKLLSIAPSDDEVKSFLAKEVGRFELGSEFQAFVDKPVKWADFLGKSEKCMAQNQYFLRFACRAKKHPKWFSTVNDKLLKEAMLLSVFLDRTTNTIVGKPSLAGAVQDNMKKLRKKTNCQSIYKGAKGLFAKAKIWAVDLTVKGQAKSMKKPADAARMGGWKIALNIYEAVVLDLLKKKRSNARAGVVLAAYTAGSKTENPITGEGPSKWVGSPPKLSQRFPLGSLWADLYQSWNLAFVFGTYTSFPLFFAKLLIPSVSCYQDTNGQFYLWNRSIALMLFMNWGCLSCKEKGATMSKWEITQGVVLNQAAIKAWGGNNMKFSVEYRKTMRRLDPPVYRVLEKKFSEEWARAKKDALLQWKAAGAKAKKLLGKSFLSHMKELQARNAADRALQPMQTVDQKGNADSVELSQTADKKKSGAKRKKTLSFSERIRAIIVG